MHDQSPTPPQAGEHAGVEGNECFAEDTGQLAIGTGRIEQRTEHVENGRLTAFGEQFAGRGHCGKGRVEARREEKGRPRFTQHVEQPTRRQINRNIQGFKHVGAPAFRGDPAVAVFDQPRTGSRGDEHDRRGDIEESQLVPPGATDIDDRTEVGRHFERHGMDKKFFGQGGDFSGCFAPLVERTQERGLGLGRHGRLKQPSGHFAEFPRRQFPGRSDLCPVAHGKTSSRRRTNSGAGH